MTCSQAQLLLESANLPADSANIAAVEIALLQFPPTKVLLALHVLRESEPCSLKMLSLCCHYDIKEARTLQQAPNPHLHGYHSGISSVRGVTHMIYYVDSTGGVVAWYK